jgi:hypothetical protein
MVTYLTKEQKAQLEKQRKSAAAAAAASSSGSNQFIMSIDMATWRDMCRAVPRGQGLMPHRQPAADAPDAAAAAGSSRQRQRR